ncbi:EAL domain-containing protein [Pseudomonas sp. Irchel s3b6]|uniref:EAL domain-containing response regulator n=1 Tax=Pseudomonas sp. Irchel s3b6 TaxID=2009078 RepID=UPI000BA4AAF8|nr:EAL domain-containing response regulator [Pseudomonas sp. Irchel s3b6]
MRSLNVLVLEDNAFQLMALHKMLNAIQVFNVLTADSVEVAQQALANRGGVDIAICDLQMDGQDGLDMIRFLAKYRLARALIILSGTDQSILDGAAHFARSQGILVLGSLCKPMSLEALCQLLETYQNLVAQDAQSLPLKQISQRFSLEELHQLAPGQRISGAGMFEQWVAYYQPKVSLEGQLAGVEALVRWQHPIHGLMSPGQFMGAVESAGLIEPLTWRMLELALTLSSRVLRERGERLPVSVNIPPSMIERDDFARQVLALLGRFGLPANVLTLEIVENPSLQTTAAHLEGLLRLRMQGCHLSIDDFGTGASNIQRLLQLPFSELKIPAEFVRGIGDNGRKASVVAGALFMAQKMALSVVVEGVETACDYRALQELGGLTVQGYFIARPMSEVDLLCWIEERTNLGGLVKAV